MYLSLLVPKAIVIALNYDPDTVVHPSVPAPISARFCHISRTTERMAMKIEIYTLIIRTIVLTVFFAKGMPMR